MIFNDNNYIGTIIWNNATDNNPTQIATEHEYIICYAKDIVSAESIWKSSVSSYKDILIEIGNKFNAEYDNKEQMQKAYTKWFQEKKAQLGPLDRYKYIDSEWVYLGSQSVHNPGRGGYHYDVIHPTTGKPCKEPLMGYRFPETSMQVLLDTGKILFGKDENKIIEIKVYAKDFLDKLSSIFELDGRISSYDLKALFGEKPIFSNPKPVQMLSRLMSFILHNGDIVLDFFSGSATIAESAMLHNVYNQHDVKYICVQYQENLDKSILTANTKNKEIIRNSIEMLDSIDKPHNICEIGKERIRRAAKKIHEDKPQAVFDDGFKVFEVGGTTIRWNTTNDDEIRELVDFDLSTGSKDDLDFTPNHNDTDIVYEIMLRQYGIPLSTPIEKLPEISERTYIFADAVVVCLEPEIDDKLIEKLANIEPTPAKFVLRDSAFGDNIEFKEVSFRKLSALISNHQIQEERNSKYNNYTVEFI